MSHPNDLGGPSLGRALRTALRNRRNAGRKDAVPPTPASDDAPTRLADDGPPTAAISPTPPEVAAEATSDASDTAHTVAPDAGDTPTEHDSTDVPTEHEPTDGPTEHDSSDASAEREPTVTASSDTEEAEVNTVVASDDVSDETDAPEADTTDGGVDTASNSTQPVVGEFIPVDDDDADLPEFADNAVEPYTDESPGSEAPTADADAVNPDSTEPSSAPTDDAESSSDADNLVEDDDAVAGATDDEQAADDDVIGETTPAEPEAHDAVDNPDGAGDLDTELPAADNADTDVGDTHRADTELTDTDAGDTELPAADNADTDAGDPELVNDTQTAITEPEVDGPEAVDDAHAVSVTTASAAEARSMSPNAITDTDRSRTGRDSESDDTWRSLNPAPQYIPPAEAASEPAARRARTTRRPLWIASGALVVVAVIAVVLAVFFTRSTPPAPEANQAADAARTYTSALAHGKLSTLRDVTCGERKAFYDNMSDQAFNDQYRAQKEAKQLVNVRSIVASRVEDPRNAVVEVAASAGSGDAKNVILRLRKTADDSSWKVCSAG